MKDFVRDGPFDIQGAGSFLEKLVCFPTVKKIECLQRVKNKNIFTSFSEFFQSPFPLEL